MSWNRWGRTKSGRLLVGAGALSVALGLSGCLKGPPPPSTNFPPQWSSTTVSFQHAPTGPAGAPTGWVTTVTVPPCNDAEGPTTFFAVASNGFLIPQGGGVYTWTRAVTGSPAQRVAGTFSVDCRDTAGQVAHPTLSVQG